MQQTQIKHIYRALPPQTAVFVDVAGFKSLFSEAGSEGHQGLFLLLLVDRKWENVQMQKHDQ